MLRTFVILTIISLLCISAQFQSPAVSLSHALEVNALDFQEILNNLNYTRIYEHIRSFSSMGSRVTGYEGCRKAAEYISNLFSSYGLDVQRQRCSVLIPIDINTTIILPQAKIEAYALWPNFVQTCRTPEPIKGRLIYGGHGEMREFNNKVVNGSIVVMEFNSGDNWINAAKLGAKAVIFVEPSDASWNEARKKFLNTPIHFPRIYVSQKDGILLKELADKNVMATVYVNMKYEEVQADNIIGVINGTTYPEDVIVVAAHYDTWSVVPKIAPGADEAASIASLLELSRYFGQNPPERTIMFVALSGHWQAVSGAREFVEKYFFDEKVLEGERKLWAFLSLDFSTESTEMGLLYAGSMYEYTGTEATQINTRWSRWLGPRVFKQILPRLESQTGHKYMVEDGFLAVYGWWTSIYGPYMLDSEPFAIAHGLGFALRSTAPRKYWGTPISDLRYLNIENLKPQLEVAASIVYDLAINGVNMDWSLIAPARALMVAGGADVAGYITLYGQVLTYNLSTGWYTPVSDAIVSITRVSHDYSSYPFIKILTKAGEDGRFTVHGIGGLFTVSHGTSYSAIYIDAYKISEKTSLIEFAPDLGQYGAMQLPFTFHPQSHPYNVTTIVFKSSSIVFFDVIDPTNLSPITFLDPRFQSQLMQPWHSAALSFQIYDFSSMSEYQSWGFFSLGFENVAMLFVPPNSRALIMCKLGQPPITTGILVSASKEHPEGEGIIAPEGREVHVTLTSYRFSSDMLTISKYRYAKLKSGFVQSFMAKKSLTEAENSMTRAKELLKNLKYDEAYAEFTLTWAWTIRAYNEVMSMINDSLYVNSIFLSVLIVFSILSQSLFLNVAGRKRIIAISLIYVLFLGAYMFVSPVPKIATNFLMNPLSILILMLFIFVTGIFFNKVIQIAKETRLRELGKHYMERNILSLIFLSFNVSVSNMRRRKFRTALVLITVITIMTSMIALTSTVSYTRPSFVTATPSYPAYKGVLLQWGSFESAPDNIGDPRYITILKRIMGSEPAPRVWFYPESVAGKHVSTKIRASNRVYEVKAILGLSTNEPLPYNESIVNGTWLLNNYANMAVITTDAAKKLDVSVGDTIEVEGYHLIVVGIIDPTVANQLLDLNGFLSTPVNPNTVTALLAGFITEESWEPVTYSEIIIVPYKLALKMGGYLTSVAFKTENITSFFEATKELPLIYRGLGIYLCDGKNVWTLGPLVTIGFQGSPVLVIFAIASLVIANTIIGGIYERVREIHTYSSLGLSPKGVGIMFMLESVVYSFIAVILGYLLGISLNISLIKLRMLPPDFLVNSSSLASLLAMGLTILSTIIPSIYPAIIASKIVVPSLERKWRITSKPKGDVWEINLPFTFKEEEAKAVLRYLREHLLTRTVETPDPYIVEDVKLLLKEGKLVSKVTLQPIEAGVTQEVTIDSFFSTDERRIKIILILKRLSGSTDTWTSMNRRFIDSIRKQFLIWMSLSSEEKEKYYR